MIQNAPANKMISMAKAVKTVKDRRKRLQGVKPIDKEFGHIVGHSNMCLEGISHGPDYNDAV